jgi:hypothetical protein
MSKGSGRRKQDITDKELQDAWNRIFSGHPNEKDHMKIRKKDKNINYNIVFDNQDQKEKWLWFLECLEERYLDWENINTVGEKIIEHLENPFFSIGRDYHDDGDDGYGKHFKRWWETL